MALATFNSGNGATVASLEDRTWQEFLYRDSTRHWQRSVTTGHAKQLDSNRILRKLIDQLCTGIHFWTHNY